MKQALVSVGALFMALFAFVFSLIMVIPLTIAALFAGRRLRKQFTAHQPTQASVIEGEWEEITNHKKK